MIRQIYHKPRIDWILLFMLACLLVILASCELFKKTTKKETDSMTSSVKTSAGLDTSKSGSVTKTNTNTKEQDEWWRKIIQYPVDTSHDVTNVYPSTIIYEGGKGTKETNTQQIDSNWLKAYIAFAMSQKDTTHASASSKEVEKQSETKGLGVWLFVICFAGYWLLTTGLPWVVKRVKFVKPI